MPRRNLYADAEPRDLYADPDPFGEALLTLLDTHQDIASEAVWQQMPRLIARRWQAFSKDQSPLSTMGMISRCAETVLKIRLASRKGGGEEEARRLMEFQSLMAEIFAGDSDPLDAEPVAVPEDVRGVADEADEEEEG